MVGVGSQQPTHSNGSRRNVPEEPIKRSWILQEWQLHQPVITHEIIKQERFAKQQHSRRRGRQPFKISQLKVHVHICAGMAHEDTENKALSK